MHGPPATPGSVRYAVTTRPVKPNYEDTAWRTEIRSLPQPSGGSLPAAKFRAADRAPGSRSRGPPTADIWIASAQLTSDRCERHESEFNRQQINAIDEKSHEHAYQRRERRWPLRAIGRSSSRLTADKVFILDAFDDVCGLPRRIRSRARARVFQNVRQWALTPQTKTVNRRQRRSSVGPARQEFQQAAQSRGFRKMLSRMRARADSREVNKHEGIGAYLLRC